MRTAFVKVAALIPVGQNKFVWFSLTMTELG